MKKINLLILINLLLSNAFTFSQTVSETVLFNNYVSPTDNDLVNYFNGMHGLTMMPTNGITGGSCVPPDFNNWGNDISRYCSKYSITNATDYTTSVSFYYDAFLHNNVNLDRAVSIWLLPHNDFNHYIIATVSNAGKIEIYTYYSFINNFNSMNLQTGNWYNFEFGFNLPGISNPYEIVFKARVTDLGPTGLSAPVLVDSLTGSVADTVFATDDAVEVAIAASKYGGVANVDNFSYNGVKSADSCLFTSINSPDNLLNDVRLISDNNTLIIISPNFQNKEVVIFTISGKILLKGKLNSEDTNLDISKLNNGIYFLSINNDSVYSTYKFSVLKH